MENRLPVIEYDSQLKKAAGQYENEITIIEVKANEIVVDNNDSLNTAVDYLSHIANTKKNVEDTRKTMVKPINDGLKAINEWFKRFSVPLEQADKTLRGKILVYRQEQDRLRREEEERLRKLQEKEQKRLERQAAKKGAPPPPPPVAALSVHTQDKTVRSGMGTVSAKRVWKVEVVDESMLPREYMIPNYKAINAAVKAGVRQISGCRIWQEEELSVRSK